MPRSILAQRDQWPDRYADNNLITSPGDTDEVNNPAANQNDNDFYDANNGDPLHPRKRTIEELSNAIQQEKGLTPHVPGEDKIPGASGSASSGSSLGAPGGGSSAGGVSGGGGASPGGGAPSQSLTEALTKAGIDPKMHALISGFSATEGNNPSGAPTLGFTDSQAGTSLDQHAQALAKQLKDRQSVAGAFPDGGSPQQQAAWMAKVVGQNGSPSDWQGNAQPSQSDYINRIVKSMPASTPGAAPAAASGAANQGAPAASSGFRQVNPSHGQGPIDGPDVHGQLPPDMVNFQNNLKKQFPQLPDSAIGTYRKPDPGGFDEHSSGHGMDVMMPGDPALQKQVKDWALQQPNVNFVLNQQQQFNPDGSSSKMETRNNGNPTDNHYDHDHINVAGDFKPDPTAAQPATQPTVAPDGSSLPKAPTVSGTPAAPTTPAAPQQPQAPAAAPPTVLPTTLPSATTPPTTTPTQDDTQPPPQMTIAQRKRASTFFRF